jgi:hypothetical protein
MQVYRKKKKNFLSFTVSPAAPAGIYGGAGSGRPHPMPLVRHFSCLISRENVPITVLLDGKSVPLPPVATAPLSSTPPLTGPLPTDEIDVLRSSLILCFQCFSSPLISCLAFLFPRSSCAHVIAYSHTTAKETARDGATDCTLLRPQRR